MSVSLVTPLRRHRAIIAAFLSAIFAAIPAHAEATAQPAKVAAPKTTAVSATSAQPSTTAAAAPQQPPAKSTKPVTTAKPATTAQKVPEANRVFVDINHATLAELKNIPGIGDAYGKKIIAGRPYANKSQLVSKKVIDAKLYETIQGMIIAKQ